MCGIISLLGINNYDRMKEIMIQGLDALKNRGYDSCGMCYIENNTFQCIKHITSRSVKLLEKDLNERTTMTMTSVVMDSSVAIGHTRWATHGHVNVTNAHPHFDNKRNVSIVHNGIIENAHELKQELEQLNYTFYSQTDTEVIAVLTGYYNDKGYTMKEAIERTIERLRGTWAIVFIHRSYPNTCWITRNGSPLLLGIDDDFVLIASEKSAFGTHVNKYIIIEDHNVLDITKSTEGTKSTVLYSQNNVSQYYYNADDEELSSSSVFRHLDTSRFAHWMLKEIHEQPECVKRALNNGGRILNSTCVKLGGLELHASKLLRVHHLVLLGCGTSRHAALWSSYLFKQLEVFDTVTVHDGGEFTEQDLPRKGTCGVVFITQSGETKDLHRCIQIVKQRDVITIGVTNVVDSMIARETDCGVYLNCGKETAVASTKSFTNQCVVLSLIAVWFSQHRGSHVEKRRSILSDVTKLSFQMTLLLQSVDDRFLETSVDTLENKQSVFVLGKGRSVSIAMEGALKIKEITYIHAEAYSSSSLKHGPLSLIDYETPVIMLDIDNDHHCSNWNCYQEIMARGGNVLYVTNDPSQRIESILIDRNTTYSGLLANIVLQLISYFVALRRGNDIDCPRNLAKVVTVY